MSFEKIAIAFSGGVDSTFLLKVAHNVLGNNAIAITIKSVNNPKRELEEAIQFTKQHNIELIILEANTLSIPEFSKNPKNRCYLCKKQLLSQIIEVANQKGINVVAEGSNADDSLEYRPGSVAISELNVKSPLKDVGLTKDEIRILSKQLNLKTADKPSFACLVTRIPYNEEITVEKLQMIEQAEQIMFNLGFKQLRVRHHGNIARIEVSKNNLNSFEEVFKESLRSEIYNSFKKIGFEFVCIDLLGYRTGSFDTK